MVAPTASHVVWTATPQEAALMLVCLAPPTCTRWSKNLAAILHVCARQGLVVHPGQTLMRTLTARPALVELVFQAQFLLN